MSDSAEQIEAKLAAYVDGELTAAERAEIEAHLTANPSHKALIAELMRHRQMVMRLPRELAPAGLADELQNPLEREALLGDDPAERRSVIVKLFRAPQFLSAAAIVALAVGLGALVYSVLPAKHQEVALSPAPEDRAAADAVAEAETLTRGGADADAMRRAAGNALAVAPGDSRGSNNIEVYGTHPAMTAPAEGVASNRPEQPSEAFARLGTIEPTTLVITVSADDLEKARGDVLAYLSSNNIAWAAADGATAESLASLANAAVSGDVRGGGAGGGFSAESGGNRDYSGAAAAGSGGALPRGDAGRPSMAGVAAPAAVAAPTRSDLNDTAGASMNEAMAAAKDVAKETAEAKGQSLMKKSEDAPASVAAGSAGASSPAGGAGAGAGERAGAVPGPDERQAVAKPDAGVLPTDRSKPMAGREADATASATAPPIASAQEAGVERAEMRAEQAVATPAPPSQPTPAPSQQGQAAPQTSAPAEAEAVASNASPTREMSRARRVAVAAPAPTGVPAPADMPAPAGPAAPPRPGVQTLQIGSGASPPYRLERGQALDESRAQQARPTLIVARDMNPAQARQLAETLTRPEQRQTASVQRAAFFSRSFPLADQQSRVVPLNRALGSEDAFAFPTTQTTLTLDPAVRLDLGQLSAQARTSPTQLNALELNVPSTLPAQTAYAVNGVSDLRVPPGSIESIQTTESGTVTISPVPGAMSGALGLISPTTQLVTPDRFGCVIVLQSNPVGMAAPTTAPTTTPVEAR